MARNSTDNETVTKTTKKKVVKKKVVAKKTAPKNVTKKKAVTKKAATKQARRKSKITAEEKNRLIMLNAYYKWENSGRPDNCAKQHWLEAEMEIELIYK